MQISNNEIKKILNQHKVVADIEAVGQELAQREVDAPMIKRVVKDVINMPDREDRIAELKAKIDSGAYNPSGEEIADAMIRRSIADHVQ